MRAALGDAKILAWYDCRFPWTATIATGVSSWADARRASGLGPSIAQGTGSAQPTYSATTGLAFDGTNDALSSTSGWTGVTSDCAIVLIGTLPSPDAVSNQTMAWLETSGAAVVLAFGRLTNNNIRALAGSSSTNQSSANTDGTRAFHVRRAKAGSNTTTGMRVGAVAESTGTAAQADATAANFKVGFAGSVFADVVVKAILVFNGTYTAAHALAVNEWARSAHKASI